MTSDIVIQTDGLTKRFGEITAVDNLSMEVRRGHIYGLLGPNGSGKTTTMGMLLGLATLVMSFVLACGPPPPVEIAFVRWHDFNPEIYGMSADGSGQTRLTDIPVPDGSPSWSPDGDRIAFDSLRCVTGTVRYT